MKRLQAAKKLRDKRRKETEAVMQNKANVRVRQRTLVHITGMTTKQANEDVRCTRWRFCSANQGRAD